MKIDLHSDLDQFKRLPSSVIFAASYIEKFNSVHLGMESWCDGTSAQVWIGEVNDPFPSIKQHNNTRAYKTEFHGEGIKIFIERYDSGLTVYLVRTGVGSTPMYLHSTGDRLVCSWDFGEVVRAVEAPKVNRGACRTYIDEGPSVIREQIIDGVFLLWPGDSVRVHGEKTTFEGQDELPIVAPSYITDDAQVCDAFLHVIADNLRSKVERSSGVLLEISGGLDSSCTALAASKIGRKLYSYGLIHEGAMGRQQSRRRMELVNLLSLTDYEYPSFQEGPIVALYGPEGGLTPNDDNHRSSCGAGIDGHAESGIDLLISGIGGDELFMRGTYRRTPSEVPGNISYTTAAACISRADMCLRRGIWPANPFAAQTVVDFCRRLPESLIEGRMLEKLSLARAGLSDGYIFPRYAEHYGHVLSREASLLDFDALIADSILLEEGLGDVHRLFHEARLKSLDGFTSQDAYALWKILKLEAVLHRYLRA